MSKRLDYIEGIRGWAALVVLVFHLTRETFGASFPVYHSVWLNFWLDGPLAVYVFFILSGDALSTTFLKTQDLSFLARMVVKRYFRLAGPILAACLMVYVIMKAGLNFNHEASVIVQAEDWLGSFINFPPNFARALKYGLLDVFVEHRKEKSYVPFLWPMSIELYGSFMLFTFLAIFAKLKRPMVVLLVAASWLTALGSFYGLFFVGMCFSAWRELGVFNRPVYRRWSVALILIAVVADSLLTAINAKPPQASIVIGVCLVFGLYSNPRCLTFFSNRLSRYLGRISFPLYLTHFSVLISFTSWAILKMVEFNRFDVAHSLAVAAASGALALVVAELFTRVERRYLQTLNQLVSRVVRS
jgi:peptidoglycan/LPS O-acetylase OafA/YrhL